VLAACERILGEIARQSGDLAAAEHRISRSFEIGRELDSGALNALPDEIERLDRCEIDTLIEFAIGESETLAVVVGGSGRTAKRLPVGRASIEELVRRLLDAKTFDEKAARELHGKLLQPFEAQLGARIGIVPEGALANVPFEMLITETTHRSFGRDHSIVYLSHPPLGGANSAPGAGAAQAAGSFVVSEVPGPERAASTEKLHAAGVRDVVANLWPVDAAKETFLLRFHKHLADGESVPEASRSARRELMDGSKEAGVEPVGPRIWAAWIVHRRF
jgi:CHAT domain-containing protein